jgi:hypothetical protein
LHASCCTGGIAQQRWLPCLAFDGSSLVLENSAPCEPTSLEWGRGEILKLHADNGKSDAAVSKLTTIAIVSLALYALALLMYFVTRRKN